METWPEMAYEMHMVYQSRPVHAEGDKIYKIHNWIVPCSTFSQTILDLYVPMLDHKAPAVVEMVLRSWQDQAALRASFPTHSDAQKAVAFHLLMEQQQKLDG